jgi:hypothetical protein
MKQEIFSTSQEDNETFELGEEKSLPEQKRGGIV